MSSVNTFERPPRSPRIQSLPDPYGTHAGTTTLVPDAFAPTLAPPPKTQTVARIGSLTSPVVPSRPRGGAPPVAPAPAPPPVPQRRRSTLPTRVLAGILLMAVAVGAVFVHQRMRTSAPAHPAKWDAEIAPIVSFVEDARGLRFKHPVYLDLIAADEYASRMGQQATPDDAGATARAKDRSDIVDAFGFAVGYEGSADIDQSADSTRGTYSPTTDRISLRGTELTPGLRAVLAHELTHALQAQHFDMRLGGPDDFTKRSIAEADAMRVEQAYLDSLDPAERSAATSENGFDSTEAAQLARVPWPMIEFRFAPYWLGPTLVQGAVQRGGNAAVDALLRELPSENELISPWRRPGAAALANDTAAPPAPAVPEGATVVQPSSPIAMIQALVMLDAWLPWAMARGALDHWSTGSYTAYRRAADNTLCLSVVTAFDGAPDGFATAVGWWAIASGSTATPVIDGHTVTFQACARGAAATNPPFPAIGPSTEIILEDSAVKTSGATDLPTAAPALCVIRAVIDNAVAAPLLPRATLTPLEQAVVDQARASARQTCGT